MTYRMRTTRKVNDIKKHVVSAVGFFQVATMHRIHAELSRRQGRNAEGCFSLDDSHRLVLGVPLPSIQKPLNTCMAL